jgi:hypothetical protein
MSYTTVQAKTHGRLGARCISIVTLAIVTGALSALNYYWHAGYELSLFAEIVGLVAQVFLATLTVLAAVTYRGQRSRPSYGSGNYRIWTVRFCVIIISLLGNFSVLIAFVLHIFRIIGAY